MLQHQCPFIQNNILIRVLEKIHRMLDVKKKYKERNLVYLKTCANEDKKFSLTARLFNNRGSQNQDASNKIPQTVSQQTRYCKLMTSHQKKTKKMNLAMKSSLNLYNIRQLSKIQKQNEQNKGKTKNEHIGEGVCVQKVKFLDLLRTGNFGKVYRGLLTNTTSVQVAIKKIQVDQHHKSRQQYFANKLRSPFIVQFIGTYHTQQINQKEQHRKYLNIVMKKYSNNLSEIIQLESLHPVRVKIYLYQMIRSIFYLHSASICHRDIKPHNFVIKNNRIFLCDFGASKIISQNGNNKNAFYIFQREYRAPELLFGYENYGKEVDIWALGCVMAQIIIRKPLFSGSNNLDQLIKVLKLIGTPNWSTISFCKDRVPKLPQIKGIGLKQVMGPKTDPFLLKLISKMLIIEPRDRISSIEALCDPYFDQIREESFYRAHLRGTGLPNFFYFTKRQTFGKEEYIHKLVPFWIKQHCKRFEVSIKDYNF